MKSTNLPSGALRTADVGLVWQEVQTNTNGSLELTPYTTFRVRAVAASTVSINGILAMTMMVNEIAVFNTGDVNPAVGKQTITVTTTGTVYMQVAREIEHRRQSPN